MSLAPIGLADLGMPFRGGRKIRQHEGDKLLAAAWLQRRIEAAFKPDRGARLPAHGPTAGRTGEMRRVDLEIIRQDHEPGKETVVQLGCGGEGIGTWLGEVGPTCVADEKGIAGEDKPRKIPANAITNQEADAIRAMTRRVHDTDEVIPQLNLVAIAHWLMREVYIRRFVEIDRCPGSLGKRLCT